VNRSDLQRLKERLKAIVAELPLPNPWNLETFLEALGHQRNRPIIVRPIELDGPTPADMPSGLWIPRQTEDYIFYEPRTSRPHRQHCICHEVGHMVLRHKSDPNRPGQYLHRVFENIDPALLDAARARTSYRFIEEQEAEMVATLILDGAGDHRRTPRSVKSSTARQWHSALGLRL